MRRLDDKIVIGKSDKADFPELKLTNINVKIDTGAYTSSIHCSSIKKIKIGRKSAIRVIFLDATHKKFKETEHLFSSFRTKRIKSSNGEVQERYLIKTSIVLFGNTYPVELSLSERGEMRFPVLIGRKLLNRKFVVDTAVSYVSYKTKKENKRKNLSET